MIGDLLRLPRPLFFLYAGTIVTRMGAFVFPYLTIYLSESRGFGFDHVGLILSVGSVGLLIGNYVGGWLTDHWSRKWTLIASLLINATGFGGLAIAYDAGWPYALFLLIGYFGSGMYNPAANTLIADLAEDSVRPFAYTLNYVCINVGMALGPLIGGFLASVAYRWIFVGDILSSLLCAGLIALGVRGRPVVEEPRLSESQQGAPIALATGLIWFRHPLVLVFCLAYFFLICPLMGLEYAVPILVKDTFSHSLTYVGIIYTTNALCVLCFSFAIEKFIRRFNALSAMIGAGCFWAAGLMILLVGYSISSLWICTVVWTIGEIIASIVVPTFVADRVDAEVKGRFLALNDMVRSLAGILCPVGLGLVWTHWGPRMAVMVLVALPFIAIVSYLSLLLVDRFAVLRSGHRRMVTPSESTYPNSRAT